MTKVITVTLRKGGSGKTTTAVNLASALAKHGHKVLLIDLDPQANASVALGVDTATTPHISEVLQGTKQIQHVINDPGKGFDLIAGTNTNVLAQIDASMATDPGKYANIIKAHLALITESYDYIIIDTAPAENMLTIAALAASDYALIPTQAHYLAMHGLQQALDMVARVKDSYNPTLEVLGIVPTMVQTGTNMADLFIEQLKGDYGDLLLPYPIPHTIKMTESQLVGQPITDYDAHHPAAVAYMQLAKHITERP